MSLTDRITNTEKLNDTLLLVKFDSAYSVAYQKHKKGSLTFTPVPVSSSTLSFYTSYTALEKRAGDIPECFDKGMWAILHKKMRDSSGGKIEARIAEIFDEIIAPLNIQEKQVRDWDGIAKSFLLTLSLPITAPLSLLVAPLVPEVVYALTLAPSELRDSLKNPETVYSVKSKSLLREESGKNDVAFNVEHGNADAFKGRITLSFPNGISLHFTKRNNLIYIRSGRGRTGPYLSFDLELQNEVTALAASLEKEERKWEDFNLLLHEKRDEQKALLRHLGFS